MDYCHAPSGGGMAICSRNAETILADGVRLRYDWLGIGHPNDVLRDRNHANRPLDCGC